MEVKIAYSACEHIKMVSIHDRIKLTLGGYSPIQYRLMNQQMI